MDSTRVGDTQDNSPARARRSPAEPVSRKTRTWTLIIIGLLVAAWCVAMYYRMEIRAYWWARQLSRTTAPEQRTYYLVCLASIKNKSLGAATRMTRNSDPHVRELGVAVLNSCTGPEADEVLIRLLDDADDNVADDAALTLTDARRGSGLAMLPRLRSILDKGGRPARRAVVAMQRVPGQQTETLLAEAMARTDDPDLLAQIMDSLAMIASRAAVPRMIACLEDTRPVGPPYSERSAIRALTGAGSQLMTKGLDPAAVLAAMPQSRTVADVALRCLQILADRSAPTTSTAPADVGDLKTLRQKWEEWWKTRSQSRPRS